MNPSRGRPVAFRADDAGACADVTRGILDAVDAGVVRNVSVMVPPPDFPAAAALLRDRADVDIGLHVTLNCEWEGLGWQPVLGAGQVSTLVDAHGCLWPSPAVLHARAPRLAEMVAETRAQLGRMREVGLRVAYLDEHMSVGWLPGLREALRELARAEGLALAMDVPVLAALQGTVPSADEFLARLDASQEGGQVITHPALDGEVVRAWREPGRTEGTVARIRAADRAFLLDPRLREACGNGRVRPARLAQLARELRDNA